MIAKAPPIAMHTANQASGVTYREISAMSSRRAVLLICLALTGCATSRPMALPGGGEGYMIGCNGIQLTMADCLAKAAEMCPSGYDIAAATAESVPIINPYARTMMVRCK